MTFAQIQSALSAHKNEIIALGVEELYLFGSVLREENNLNSDVDILVKFRSGKKNFDNFMDLYFQLEEILNTKVDLLTEDSISDEFKNSIMAEVLHL
ncbi:nucleotidyltransferase family protein [Leptospira sarikeiensis]|uniref:Nucleotidyltransferase n=1 Tax=Leptospira sarikeiensis TaxID=2484943 RepID=A0A4R9KA73_9LEPT|nr:nucleotidyltransferase domain-containing protein [Leptospira sarikeiensis]TGL62360.1 nucleotidyltransferase [Leptospira sarikeiensis]